MKEAIKFTAIIPAYNEELYIIKTLESIANQQLAQDESFSIIIVNNNSTDQTEQLIKEYILKKNLKISIIVINEAVKGMVPARRAGVEKAIELFGIKNHWILSCDADTLYNNQWVNNFHKHIKMSPDTDFFQGISKYDDLIDKYHNLLGLLGPYFKKGKEIIKNNKQTPIADAALCFSAKSYREAGGYSRDYNDEGIEEVLVAWRLYMKMYLRGFKRTICEDLIAIQSSRRDSRQFIEVFTGGGTSAKSYLEDIREIDLSQLQEINKNPQKFITKDMLENIIIARVALMVFSFKLIELKPILTAELSSLNDAFQNFFKNEARKDLYLFKPSLVLDDAKLLAQKLRSEILDLAEKSIQKL